MKLYLSALIVAFVITLTVFGQEAPPKKTDSTYVKDSGGGLNALTCAGQSVIFEIPIKRVVAPTDSEGKVSGSEAEIEAMINNGVIPRYVTLRMPVKDVDDQLEELPNCTPRERDQVLLNDQNIGKNNEIVYLTGVNTGWHTVEFEVPVQRVRFGVFQNGQYVREGINRIEIKVSPDAPPYTCGNTTVNWCATVKWGSISFKALYPVIMVHGYSSNGAFWATNRNVAGQPQASKKFIQPFVEGKYLYDNSIDFQDQGKAALAVDSAKLMSEIERVAGLYNVKHVHLIAHSKGGLVSRDFISKYKQGKVAILSLTTISTMHYGTVMADFPVDLVESIVLAALFSGQDVLSGLGLEAAAIVAAFKGQSNDATRNMRVKHVQNTFNPNNVLPPSMEVDGESSNVRYFSIGTDANRNSRSFTGGTDPVGDPIGAPTIQIAESTGSPFGRFIAEQSYRILYNFAETKVRYLLRVGPVKIPLRIEFIDNTNKQVNDFFVTVRSSRFQSPVEDIGEETYNHQEVARSEVATKIIGSIKSAQP